MKSKRKKKIHPMGEQSGGFIFVKDISPYGEIYKPPWFNFLEPDDIDGDLMEHLVKMVTEVIAKNALKKNKRKKRK